MNKIFRTAAILRRSMCTAPSEKAGTSGSSMHARYRPSEFQKTILVWTKKYKSKSEVPDFVSAEVIERSRSEARIKISNILIVLTALASFGAVMAGKSAAKRGESAQKLNQDWHKQYQDEHKKAEAEATK